MEDLGEVSFVLNYSYRNSLRWYDLLVLSQKAYINRVPKRFNTDDYSLGSNLIVKGDKFSKSYCPKNYLKRDAMEQICMHPQLEA